MHIMHVYSVYCVYCMLVLRSSTVCGRIFFKSNGSVEHPETSYMITLTCQPTGNLSLSKTPSRIFFFNLQIVQIISYYILSTTFWQDEYAQFQKQPNSSFHAFIVHLKLSQIKLGLVFWCIKFPFMTNTSLFWSCCTRTYEVCLFGPFLHLSTTTPQ